MTRILQEIFSSIDFFFIHNVNGLNSPIFTSSTFLTFIIFYGPTLSHYLSPHSVWISFSSHHPLHILEILLWEFGCLSVFKITSNENSKQQKFYNKFLLCNLRVPVWHLLFIWPKIPLWIYPKNFFIWTALHLKHYQHYVNMFLGMS